MKKTDKVKMINDAIGRSSVATKKQAKASIDRDGNIEYTMLSRNGKYTMRVKYSEILATLHGEDMRKIHSALGYKI